MRLAKEKPHQLAKVKEQALSIAGPEAFRKAVTALVSAQSKAPAPAPAPAAPPRPALPPIPPPLTPLGGIPFVEPPMPANLQAIFGSQQSPEEFKASLVHAFHCGRPGCDFEKCQELQASISRMEAHIERCEATRKLPPGAPVQCKTCQLWCKLQDAVPS